MNREEIRDLIAEVLNTTLINPEGGPETAADRHTRHDAHKFYYRCAVCQGDVPLLADAIAAKICLTAESPPSPGAPDVTSPEREVPAPAPPAADPGRSGGAGHTPRDPACGTPGCGHPRSAHNLTRTRRWTDCSVITGKTGACACVRFTDPATKEPA
jgi:hypothetical protein